MDTPEPEIDRKLYSKTRQSYAARMKDRIKTLVLDANGFGWKPVVADTLLQGVLHIHDSSKLPPWVPKISLLQRALNRHYEALSYVMDWREELERAPELDVEVCNINNLLAFTKAQRALVEYPLVIILHAAAGDSMVLLLRAIRWFQKRRGKTILFIGNEYDLLDQKIHFIQEAGVEYIGSQLPEATARWLYAECVNSKVLPMPHALNPRLYHPGDGQKRPIELGFRGARYPLFIGDTERNDLLDDFERGASAWGLNIDFGYKTIRRGNWAEFLRSCKAVIGAEAGTYYLDKRGHAITSARRYQHNHPRARLKEIKEQFFNPLTNYISGKCISSRHFEPIGAKACQVLLEGNYNGILNADEHYIKINKDKSNIEDVIRRLRDEEYRRQIVERAYEHILQNHTYAHRVLKLVQTLEEDGL
ncbi:MAG: glycosyltransferase [Anaerolineaceae bacterium]|nr:glycosyltransferase [Anaerolineaceae bacterium]